MSKLTFTMSQVVEHNPCSDGLDRLTRSLGTYTGLTVVHLVDHSEHLILSDILWCLKLTTLSELEQRTICTQVAIFAARSVLDLFENERPDDQRPRLAIEAAEECVRTEFSAESVARARQANDNARVAARVAWAALVATTAALVVVSEWAWAAEWASASAERASDNPDALRAEIKNYLLELLRGYEATTMTVKDTLEEREKRYGTFEDNASVSQYLKGVIEEHHKWDSLKYYQKEALTILMQKVARILNGDPDYTDNWHDIAGYATLVEDILTNKPDNQ